jgi:hypothetical protein
MGANLIDAGGRRPNNPNELNHQQEQFLWKTTQIPGEYPIPEPAICKSI